MAYLHGVEVVEIDSGSRPISTVASAIIGIVGTAPDAELEVKSTLSTGSEAANTALLWTSLLTGVNGNDISVTAKNPNAASAPLAIAVKGKAITVTLGTDATGAVSTTAADLVAAVKAHPGASALVKLANAGASTGAGTLSAWTGKYLADGQDEAFPLNTPRLIAGSLKEAARLGDTGTLPAALDSILDQTGAIVIVVRVAEGDTDEATVANVIGGTSADGQYQGAYALLGAESALGYKPRILLAPGFTHTRSQGTANPVVAELVGIAEKLRAVICADAPGTTDDAAIAYAGDWGSSRIYLVDPPVKKLNATTGEIEYQYSSAIAAGMIAKTDNEKGFWVSPSNQTINGIVGTKRAVDFTMGDSTSRANLLNENRVTTIIRQDGYRLWGNRTLSADPKWAFLSVRRTADMINDSILKAHLWAVDQNITRNFVATVVEGVNDYLRILKAEGAIIDGEAWADKELNTAASIAQGRLYIDFKFTPPTPNERLTFRSMLTQEYLTEIL